MPKYITSFTANASIKLFVKPNPIVKPATSILNKTLNREQRKSELLFSRLGVDGSLHHL